MAKRITYSDTIQNMGHPRSHIRFKGVWDMQDLYEYIAHYLRERKYKFYEVNYKHNANSPFGSNRQYYWLATQLYDDTYRFNIGVYIHTYDTQDFSVKLPDGSTKTLTKGRLWMEFSSQIDMYEDQRWSSHPFWAQLKMFMNNYILKKRHGNLMWDVLIYREVHKLVWLVRRRLKLEYDDYEMKHWNGVHG